MPQPVRVGVLALQGDFREHVGVLRGLGADAVEVRTADELEGVSALAIPGGESTTIGRLATIYGLIGPLRERILSGMPVLGTCAGMIFLAGSTTGPPQVQLEVLDVVVERNAFGRQVASFETDHLMSVRELRRALDAVLPEDVGVLALAHAPDGFHARKHARWKWYRYSLLRTTARRPFSRRHTWHVRGRLDREVLDAGAAALEGRHDFQAFANAGSPRHTTVRTPSL